MCCFSRPVPFVGATKIFARPLPRGRQALVYAMDVEIADALAMVLPLLREIETVRRAQWRLAPLTDDLAAHFMNGDQLWSGTSYMDGARSAGKGPGRVRFTPFSEHVPAQSVTLGFEALPDRALTGEIQAELSRLLDRALVSGAASA